jgi:L-asparaginase II
VHQGLDPAGYVEPTHPIQRAIRQAMEDVTGATLVEDVCGTDGCSIPTFGVPLDALALGFARMATGEGLPPARAAAARRIMAACMAHPFMVAGSERFDTDLMASYPGRVFVKIGAEGVFCGALPEVGLGFALKIEDGASRAAEVACAAIVAAFLPAGLNETATLDRLTKPTLTNWNGRTVGWLEPTDTLRAALRG